MDSSDSSNNKNVSLNLIAEYGASDSDSEENRSNTGNEDSDTSELSEMVLKNNIINACAHGPLSRSSAQDDNETSSHMIIDNSESGILEYEVTEYRDIDSDSDSSSSDSSDSDVNSVKDIEEISSGDENESSKNSKPEIPKVNGELGLDDLPPIEDLAISLPAQETTKIGTITSIVDRLVIVRALPETPAVDIDSVLFLDNGAKALGRVFDVFGPVTEPHYCVRFNSSAHAHARAAPGNDVFVAPRSQHTNYVFLAELMKMKGSDASWLHDIEPPPHQVEYSDDEEERRANRARKEQRQNRQEESENDEDASKNARKVPERRNQRPSESSSRFGSGPSRGRNPFSAGSRRNNANAFPRFARPWPANMDLRTPPAHPNGDPRGHGPYSAPANFNGPPMYPPPFNPNTPPPLMGNMFQFGANRMQGPMPPPGVPPYRHNVPTFGSNYCNMPGPQPQWVNNGPPPPPGT